jgi:signal transduction histidine kinase
MKRFGPVPLAIRAPLIVAALMIVVGVIASQQMLSKLADTQQRQLRDLAALYLDGLSVAVLPAAIRLDVWETFDALDRATRQDRGLRALVTTVVGEDGRVLASTDPARFPTGAAADAIHADAPFIENLRLTGTDPSVRVQAPLVYQGQTVGYLHAEMDVSDLLAERRLALLYLIFGNAAGTLLLAGAGYIIVRRMLRPIAILSDHIGGDFGHGPEPIPESQIPPGANEFSGLFRKYNALVLAERERNDTARRLADQERLVSLGRLATSVAHEINNPLGGLLNAVDTLKNHGDRPGVAKTSVALLERGLLGIRDVVRAMLETHRPERTHLALTQADFDDLRFIVSPEIRRRGQTLGWQVEFSASAPETLESGPVRQACLNLLLNASAAAGKEGHVALIARTERDRLLISVQDSGPGLSPGAMRRLEGGTGDASGGGVGLRVVAEKISLIGGTISARQTDDRLTSIDISVPLAGRDVEAA